MKSDFMPGITSVSSNALLLSSTVQLLQHVEALPHGATGALAFGEDGVILVENKRVCWAVANDMKQRLTDILCQQQEPPLPRGELEELVRRCKQQGTPVGEALVASGIVSESALRSALERHTCEAIVRLAQGNLSAPPRFARHTKHGYDPRFVFTTAELLASLSGKRRNQLAEQARAHLSCTLVPDASGFAFLREVRSQQPVIIAVGKCCELAASATLDIASWAMSTFDVAGFVDPGTYLVSATWCSRVTLLAWRDADISYAAICTSRAASAMLLSTLAHRLGKQAQSARAPDGSSRGKT